MIVLGIETATIEVGVALVGPDGLLASARARAGRRHAERLHVELGEVLGAARVALDDVEGLGVDVGPGLFTGLRVGLAATKALGFALGLPIAGFTSTAILGYAARAGGVAGVVVPVLDVRRGEVAWALPQAADTSGLASRTGFGAPRLGALGELVDALAGLGGEVLLVGDGARRYAAELRAGLAPFETTVEIAGDELAVAPVEYLAGLARGELMSGRSVDAVALAPVYLRGADAEPGSWAARQPGLGASFGRDGGA